MKRHLSILAVSALALTACSSSTKKFDYPPTTNAAAEIENLESEMKIATTNQVNVLAPNSFAEAREKLDDAKRDLADRAKNEEVLEDLGYARAHLDAAKACAPRAEAAMPEVLKARNDALAADGVRLRNADLIDADKALKKTTEDFESGSPTVSVEKRGELQKMYMDVEVAAIKADHLGQAKALIDAAKKMDAKKYAAKSLNEAEASYQAAERTIEANRHDSTKIARAADEATIAAKHAVEITRLAKGMKEQSPEEAAIAMDAKRNEAAHAQAEAERNADRLAAARTSLQDARSTIRDKNSEISTIDAEKEKLERDRRFNEAFATAQHKFSSDEAEVYRQGDNLVVRLKKAGFPSGKASLSDASKEELAKVKEVAAELGAAKILVEGHTDSVGGHAQNQALSEKRADAVADYFVSEGVLSANAVEAKGFGDSKPLASNKTAAGRSLNRRVDVVISPERPDDVAATSMSSAARPADQAPGTRPDAPPPAGKRGYGESPADRPLPLPGGKPMAPPPPMRDE
ncbi:MAG: OmpA family protein [Bdellovibrionales bacterium]|nr:OmpA family protein [Bdellovibrionales bacterium]